MASIVVMDDDERIRKTIVAGLQVDGHEVQAFEDAAPALKTVDFNQIDLVITDLQMPTLGDQLILMLRERGVSVPVIVISGVLNEDRSRYLKDLGVQRLLEKPFELSALRTIVKELL